MPAVLTQPPNGSLPSLYVSLVCTLSWRMMLHVLDAMNGNGSIEYSWNCNCYK